MDTIVIRVSVGVCSPSSLSILTAPFQPGHSWHFINILINIKRSARTRRILKNTKTDLVENTHLNMMCFVSVGIRVCWRAQEQTHHWVWCLWNTHTHTHTRMVGYCGPSCEVVSCFVVSFCYILTMVLQRNVILNMYLKVLWVALIISPLLLPPPPPVSDLAIQSLFSLVCWQEITSRLNPLLYPYSRIICLKPGRFFFFPKSSNYYASLGSK